MPLSIYLFAYTPVTGRIIAAAFFPRNGWQLWLDMSCPRRILLISTKHWRKYHFHRYLRVVDFSNPCSGAAIWEIRLLCLIRHIAPASDARVRWQSVAASRQRFTAVLFDIHAGYSSGAIVRHEHYTCGFALNTRR